MKRNSPLASFRCKQYPAFRRTESFEFSNSQIASLVFVIYRLFRDRTTFERYNTIRYCVNKLTWNARRSSDEKWPKKILWRSRTGQTAFENSVEQKGCSRRKFSLEGANLCHYALKGWRRPRLRLYQLPVVRMREPIVFSFFSPLYFFPYFSSFFLFSPYPAFCCSNDSRYLRCCYRIALLWIEFISLGSSAEI